MIEFDADLEYCTEYEMLDEVVLNDKNGEMEPVTFVPKAKAPGAPSTSITPSTSSTSTEPACSPRCATCWPRS